MRTPWVFAALLVGLSGCVGELTAFAALAFSMTLGAWILGRERQRQALASAESMRLAIGSGQHRAIEQGFRKELALAEAGEAVSLERQWLARLQLAGLLVAEWRLDEAREIYGVDEGKPLAPHLQALAAFGRHELSVLTETPGEDRLEAIRRDRDACLEHVPHAFRNDVEHAWQALEGLCLVRMGRAREAATLLETGRTAIEYNPALVVYLFHLGQAYEHMGERQLAAARYQDAMQAFPGTRLASEAKSRLHALAPAQGHGFRAMLPATPEPSSALVPLASGPDEDR